jgi:hypothetical protein
MKNMSRVHYKNEDIREALSELDQLEQTMGWNLRCFDRDDRIPPEYSDKEKAGALVQILRHLPKVRGLLDKIEIDVLKCFHDQEGT